MNSREFISLKIKQITEEGIKKFPEDFLFPCDLSSFTLPSETLVIGNEFFGTYEVITTRGASFCHADTIMKAKYLVYAGRNKGRDINIPVDDKNIDLVVREYEKYLDQKLKQIERDYRKLFPESKDVNSAVNEVFRILNLKRL